ncbi:ArsA family ATPase [Altericista sp. CCNU0014]|uniref:Get3/ArsA fold putative tail anchor-mediating ATPase NosAFP n=1 Tax=Altericista sp. CCNU0014 TaxID=3082949 RepID=UPI00384A9676
MSFILTFLGKGGTGRTTAAIAAAKALSSQGQRVLLLGHEAELGLPLMLEATGLTTEPKEISPKLSVAILSASVLLEQSWAQVKQLETQYLRTPFFKNVFGQELGVLPGLDSALALYSLKNFDSSGLYDVIIYDGYSSAATLRMFGMPEVLSWYLRRFRQVFAESDLGKAVSPFLQPVAAAVLNNADWTSGNFSQPFGMADDELSQGQRAIADPSRVAAYLITTEDPLAIKTAEYLWGSAQQANLTVGGVLVDRSAVLGSVEEHFKPLPVHSLPNRTDESWQPLTQHLPNFQQEALKAPKPMAVDVAQRQVKLFLPGFAKSQVQLTQYGPELTIAAGDQRRNLFLPQELKGQKVTGAKFQDGYLIISF